MIPMMDPPWIEPSLRQWLSSLDSLPHALLLCGRPGIGKSGAARRMAAALLCEAPKPDGLACGECLACRWFEQGNHPDFRMLEPLDEEASEKAGKAGKASRIIRIEQVRELGAFLAVATHRGGRRVVMIDPSDALNVESANALLKMLEEPTPRTHFLVVCGQPARLPATVRSRCVRLDLPGPTRQAAIEWMMAATDPGQAELGHERASELLAAAAGSPLHAIGLAGSDQAAAHRSILEAIASVPNTSAMDAAERLSSIAPSQWLPILQAWVTDLGRVALGAPALRFPKWGERMAELSRRSAGQKLADYARWLDQQAAAREHPLNARLVGESVMLRYAAVFAAAPTRGGHPIRR